MITLHEVGEELRYYYDKQDRAKFYIVNRIRMESKHLGLLYVICPETKKSKLISLGSRPSTIQGIPGAMSSQFDLAKSNAEYEKAKKALEWFRNKKTKPF